MFPRQTKRTATGLGDWESLIVARRDGIVDMCMSCYLVEERRQVAVPQRCQDAAHG